MRGMDILNAAEPSSLVSALLLLGLWNHHMRSEDPVAAIGTRELARQLRMPFETARRHAGKLVAAGRCVMTADGLSVPPEVFAGPEVARVLRKMYASTARMVSDLARVGITKRPPEGSGEGGAALTPVETVFARVGVRGMVMGVQLQADFAKGDHLKGLVFSAIWTANVQHLFRTEVLGAQEMVPDSLRRPISVLAISRSLNLPYETTRRYANLLVKEGLCVREGSPGEKQGLIVTREVFMSGIVYGLRIVAHVDDVVDEIRRAGVDV
jgi:hypothetical protein